MSQELLLLFATLFSMLFEAKILSESKVRVQNTLSFQNSEIRIKN
jgi:hypothetical protein